MKKTTEPATKKEIFYTIFIAVASFTCITLTICFLMVFMESSYSLGYLSCLSKALPVIENLAESIPEEVKPNVDTFISAMNKVQEVFNLAASAAEKKYSSFTLCIFIFMTSGFMYLMGMLSGAKRAKKIAEKEEKEEKEEKVSVSDGFVDYVDRRVEASTKKEDIPNDSERVD